MKYILTIALMFVAIAQTQAQGGITIEVKGGLNFAKQAIEIGAEPREGETISEKGLTGFHLGAIVGIPITETYSFETGLMFSRKGGVYESKYTPPPSDDDEFVISPDSESELNEAEYLLHYLDIPLHIKGTFPINEKMNFFGIVGPTISFATGGELKVTKTTSYEEESDETESSSENLKIGNGDADNFKSFDFGFTFGAGVQFDKLSIGLNYDLGLANISSVDEIEDEIENSDGETNIKKKDQSYKNRVFSISIGYRL